MRLGDLSWFTPAPNGPRRTYRLRLDAFPFDLAAVFGVTAVVAAGVDSGGVEGGA